MTHIRVTAKHYVQWFAISLHTAYKWIAQDRKSFGRKRLLFGDIADKYGLTMEDVVEILQNN